MKGAFYYAMAGTERNIAVLAIVPGKVCYAVALA
jgi:hypothetical protein